MKIITTIIIVIIAIDNLPIAFRGVSTSISIMLSHTYLRVPISQNVRSSMQYPRMRRYCRVPHPHPIALAVVKISGSTLHQYFCDLSGNRLLSPVFLDEHQGRLPFVIPSVYIYSHEEDLAMLKDLFKDSSLLVGGSDVHNIPAFMIGFLRVCALEEKCPDDCDMILTRGNSKRRVSVDRMPSVQIKLMSALA